MRIALSLLLLLALTCPVAADEAGHPVTLWKVSGGTNSVYLLGSIHLLRSEDYPLPSVFYTAYDDAEVLIMEVDMDDLDPFAAQAAFTTHGIMRDGQTLETLMGDELYADALAAAAIIDIPLDMLQKAEPWYAAMTIEIMMLSRIGFDPSLGVEMHMMAKAAGDGKTIDGLETIEEQVRFLDSMSLEAQRAMLLSTLTESARIGEMMDEMIDAWRHGDAAYIASNMLDELAKHEELNKALVTDRNTRWVEQIDELLDDEIDYLVIVGALHLVGEGGVPERLQRRGHDVHQLSERPTLR